MRTLYPQLPSKTPHTKSRDHKALHRGTLGDLGKDYCRDQVPSSLAKHQLEQETPPIPMGPCSLEMGPNSPLLEGLLVS